MMSIQPFWKNKTIFLCIPPALALGLMAIAVGRVNRIRTANSSKVSFAPMPVAVPVEFVIGSHPDWVGTATSHYRLVEFIDYECPPCRDAHRILPDILERYNGKLRLTVRQFPLAMHENALPAALAAEAAREQGKFLSMHEALITTDDLSEAGIARCVDTVGLDPKQFRKDREQIAKNSVRDDVAAAKRIGLTGTPTFYLCNPTGEVLQLSSLDQLADLVH